MSKFAPKPRRDDPIEPAILPATAEAILVKVQSCFSMQCSMLTSNLPSNSFSCSWGHFPTLLPFVTLFTVHTYLTLSLSEPFQHCRNWNLSCKHNLHIDMIWSILVTFVKMKPIICRAATNKTCWFHKKSVSFFRLESTTSPPHGCPHTAWLWWSLSLTI